jgi:hypothetical protein
MRKELSRDRKLPFVIATALGLAVVYIARRLRQGDYFDAPSSDPLDSWEQGITVRATLEAAETAWVDWCASGRSHLEENYAVRFEPAPGARGTEIYVAGGGSKGTIREELRRFKQTVETGDIPLSDGPGLWRPAQPRRDSENARTLTGDRR